MACNKLNILQRPKFNNPRLLLGFSGWMDGGGVSTGIVRYFINKLNADKLASIDSEEFYIYSFPGSMELAVLFRPHIKIEDGLIKSFAPAENMFFYDEQSELILFLAKEPNLKWQEFANCIFDLCSEFGVKVIYFIGSVAGLVPHTREPRILCSTSDKKVTETLKHYGIKPASYEGPGSFISYMTLVANSRGLDMASLVTAIPAYVQGDNPKCIEAVTRRIAGILELEMNFDDLTVASGEFEKKLNELVKNHPELAENIRKLEEDYDNEIFDNEMGDLKEWLQQRGIRVD
ncbi:MAG: PAC2 family protein [Planctomycetota bacterium]|jgi:proteasome assembly chaperone (PAC2) family protein